MTIQPTGIDRTLAAAMRPRLTKRTFLTSALVALALVIGVGAVLPKPAAAHHVPLHSTQYAWCFGAQDDWSFGRYVRVERPVVWAFNYRQGVQDTQDFAWMARLFKIVNGVRQAVPVASTPWSSRITTNDGEGGTAVLPARTGYDYLYGMNLLVPDLGYEYQVWIDVYWYKSGTVPYSYQSTFRPVAHLTQTGAGWFAGDPLGSNDPAVCDYIPDRGLIPMNL